MDEDGYLKAGPPENVALLDEIEELLAQLAAAGEQTAKMREALETIANLSRSDVMIQSSMQTAKMVARQALSAAPKRGRVLGFGSIVHLYDAKEKPLTIIELAGYFPDLEDGLRVETTVRETE